MSGALNNILNVPLVSETLKQAPVVLVDVGARSGIHERWKQMEPFVRVVGFEPDPVECERLNRGLTNGAVARQSYVPTALSDRHGRRSLNLTKSPGCSSMLEPNQNFLARFPDAGRFEIQRTVDVPVDTLDNVAASVGVTPDFVKLDVQGAEMEVLRGAANTLDAAFGFEIEVEFAELYKGQPLFAEIDQHMRSNGFVLFDLKRCWWKRRGAENTANHRGQLIFGDALYLRDPMAANAPMSPSRLLKGIIIALLYEKTDYALELIKYGQEKGALTEADASTLRRRLQKGRGIFGAMPNARGRYWLARALQRFSNAVAPKSWGPSDILW